MEIIGIWFIIGLAYILYKFCTEYICIEHEYQWYVEDESLEDVCNSFNTFIKNSNNNKMLKKKEVEVINITIKCGKCWKEQEFTIYTKKK